MKKWVLFYCAGTLICLALQGCGNPDGESKNVGGAMLEKHVNKLYTVDSKGVVTTEYTSKYDSEKSNWKSFLSCWAREAGTLVQRNMGEEQRKKYRDLVSERMSEEANDLRLIGEGLGHELPPSFRDFVKAGGLGFVRYGDFRWGDGGKVFSKYKQLIRFEKHQLFEGFFGGDYFELSGTIQSHVNGIFWPYTNRLYYERFVRDAIVFGEGASDSTLFIFNPMVRTKDNEWEVIWASSHFHFLRYPSFVDFVIDLYNEDVKEHQVAPIYDSETAVKDCGANLVVDLSWREDRYGSIK